MVAMKWRRVYGGRFRLAFGLLLIVVGAFPFVPAAAAATFAVPCAGVGGGAAGLIAAITAANADPGADTITLAAGCTYALTAADNSDSNGANGLPVVTTQITIEGNGATITRSSEDAFRIVEVEAGGALRLHELTVSGGGANTVSGAGADGGGIANEGTLIVDESAVIGNGAGFGLSSQCPSGAPPGSAGRGGGIYSTGTLIVSNSTVSDNRAGGGGSNPCAQRGGGSPGGDGGGIDSSGTLTVSNCIIRGNSAGDGGEGHFGGGGGNGGGIITSGTATVSDSTIASNHAGVNGVGGFGGRGGDGGGIENEGMLSVRNSSVSANSAGRGVEGGSGGGIDNGVTGTATVSDSVISANQAGLGAGGPSGGRGGNGGGIANAGTLSLTNSSVSANSAGRGVEGGSGGGIYNTSIVTLGTGTSVTANVPDNCNFVDPACAIETPGDTTPPVIGPHADVTVEATTPTGATVTYALPVATDDLDTSITVTCSPASGTAFLIGTTTVTCSAQDSTGNAAVPTSFNVVVTDTSAPVIAAAPDIVADAVSPSGAVVAYVSPTAVDANDGPVAVTCLPANGSVFPVGSTTVTCTADDGHGNTTSAGFSVRVKGAAEQLLDLEPLVAGSAPVRASQTR